MPRITGTNPMIQAALDAGEDATGLCTVREWAKVLLGRDDPYTGTGLMTFMLDGKRVLVDTTVRVVGEEYRYPAGEEPDGLGGKTA